MQLCIIQSLNYENKLIVQSASLIQQSAMTCFEISWGDMLLSSPSSMHNSSFDQGQMPLSAHMWSNAEFRSNPNILTQSKHNPDDPTFVYMCQIILLSFLHNNTSLDSGIIPFHILVHWLETPTGCIQNTLNHIICKIVQP